MHRPVGLTPLPPANVALFAAVRKGSVRDVEALLAKGVDPNVGSHVTAGTALLLAAGLNRLSIAKVLLEGGADPNKGNALGMCPLHVAVAPLQDVHGDERASNLRLARLLLSFGADPTARDSEGRNALDYARGSEKVSALLATSFAKKLPPTRRRRLARERL